MGYLVITGIIFTKQFKYEYKITRSKYNNETFKTGSFHQSRLSFLRSFLSEFKNWDYSRDLFELDKDGYGTALYSF